MNGDFTIDLIATSVSSDYLLERKYIPLTSFKGGSGGIFGTYDENLSIKNNSQYSLTFSIAKYNNTEINPLFYMIVENRRLRLTTQTQIIDFIITSITPNVTQKNTIYNVTCQDVFSYDMSKQNITITYNSIEEYNGKPVDIKEHAKKILFLSKMESKYEIDPLLETQTYSNFPNLLTTTLVEWAEKTKVSLEVTDTTPYAAFTKLAEKYDAIIDITYPTEDNVKTRIGFKNQSLVAYKGYSVRPEVNLNSFSVSRKTDNYCSILRVSGGEDAEGNLVSLMPTMPVELQNFLIATDDWMGMNSSDIKMTFLQATYQKDGETKQYAENIDVVAVNNFFAALINIVKSGGDFLYSFDYYKNSGLMDDTTYQLLENLMTKDMRNANLLKQCYAKEYNLVNSTISSLVYEEEELIAMIAADNQRIYDILIEIGDNEITDIQRQSLKECINGIRDTRGYINESGIIDFNSIVLKDGLKNLWFKDSYNYIRNFFNRDGSDFITKRIKELQDLRHTATIDYNNYSNKATSLLDKYVPKQNNETITERETIFSELENAQAAFGEYCYYLEQANSLLGKIDLTLSLKQNIILYDTGNDGYSTISQSWTKKGRYTVYIEELEKLQDFINNSNNNLPQPPQTTITALLQQETNILNSLWNTLYNVFGDFICESKFTDEEQIDNGGLYLMAQKYFAAYRNPTVEYSTTVINMDQIVNTSQSNIELGDIIHLYNKELLDKYNGNVIFEIPYLPFVSNKAKIEHYQNAILEKEYLIQNIKHENFTKSLVYLKCDDLSEANLLLSHPCKLTIDGEEQYVLTKYLDTVAKPIELQVTGITTKLREITTQLTVSNNRIIQNLLGKLLRQVK